jgi:hypothetical protein
MRGNDPILTAIMGHALPYVALLCTLAARLAVYGSEILMGIGEEAES